MRGRRRTIRATPLRSFLTVAFGCSVSELSAGVLRGPGGGTVSTGVAGAATAASGRSQPIVRCHGWRRLAATRCRSSGVTALTSSGSRRRIWKAPIPS